MIPQAPSAIRMLAQRLLTTVVPDLKSMYTRSDGSMVGMLLMALSTEVETGIARRLADIEAMHSILKDSGNDHATAKPSSLSLTDVNAFHDELTRALITLHEQVDVANPTEPQQAVNNRIWTYLEEHAERHKLNL